MSARRTGLIALLLATVALGLLWRVLPPTTPPLYDGVCIPGQYRYLSPPPGVPNTKPNPASKTVKLLKGVQPTTLLSTDESVDGAGGAPQAQLVVAEDTFVVPPGLPSITLSIAAVPPPRTPANGSIDGNVYHLSASAGGVELVMSKPATVVLQSASSVAGARVLDHYDGNAWQPLETSPITCGSSWGASSAVLGDFVLVSPKTAPTPQPPADENGGPLTGILLAGAATVVLGGGFLVMRRTQART